MTQPNILTPKEELIGPDRRVVRNWWRFFDALSRGSGKLSAPVVIPPNSILVAGDINAGSTVDIATLPALSILGNAENVAAQPEPVSIGAGLTISASGLGAANIGPLSLAGNPTQISAPPVTIQIGEGLSMVGNMLFASPSGGGSATNFAQVVAIASWGP